MNDPARDALAAALGATGPYQDNVTRADAILAHPYTQPERRALAAAFLDVETLAQAMALAGYAEPDLIEQWALPTESAGAILAALRETP